MSRLKISQKGRWAKVHLWRCLPVFTPVIVVVVVLGMIVGGWMGGGLAQNPLALAILAVLAVLPVIFALAVTPLVVAQFLKDLYGLETLRQGYFLLSRLIFCPWTFKRHYVRIAGGEIATIKDPTLLEVGGPGYLVIYNDNAVVTQKCGRLGRVLGPGLPMLERFERIWAIVDLRPQRQVRTVSGFTRDGIMVHCEMELVFKIDDRFIDEWGREQTIAPSEQKPYPYTDEAAFKAAAAFWARESGWPKMDWVNRVMGNADGMLRNLIARQRLDWLIAPDREEEVPLREQIRRQLAEQLSDAAPDVGVRMLRVELGEFQVDDESVSQQWVEAWQAGWESRTLEARVEGEAELMRIDIAQAQAQAEMVITLTQALQSVIESGEEVEPYLLAVRFVQALRWMAYDPYTRVSMPPEAIRTLRQLQETLGGDRFMPPAEERPGRR
ncbi:MAG: hypothetical protein JW900_09095 [Anaerolineae bacterium]|nr:hypothetical protein [Anaerolineae bacterium]